MKSSNISRGGWLLLRMDVTYQLKLFIAGDTPKSAMAQANLRRFCEEHLKGQYSIEIIDLALHPELANTYNILALPTLIKIKPEPLRRIIGDLKDQARLVSALNISLN